MKKQFYRILLVILLSLSLVASPLSLSFYSYSINGEAEELRTNDSGYLCYSVGGTDYALIYAPVYSMASGGEEPFCHCFYSDGFFFEDSTVANSHLATLSMNLHFASSMPDALNARAVDEQDYTKSADCLTRFLSDLGFGTFSLSDTLYQVPTADTIGYGFGMKDLTDADGTPTDITCICIAIRGAGYKAEWENNFVIGTGETTAEAEGFAASADTVFAGLEQYISDNGLTEKAENGQLCFWIGGHSRGGTIANLVSARICDAYSTGDTPCRLYSYCFAPCKAGDPARAGDPSRTASYAQIHNYINASDFVPRLIPDLSDATFARYGEDIAVTTGDADFCSEFEVLNGETYKTGFHIAYLDLSLIKNATSLTGIMNLISSASGLSVSTFLRESEISECQSVTLEEYLSDFYTYFVSWLVKSRSNYSTVRYDDDWTERVWEWYHYVNKTYSLDSDATLEEAFSKTLGYLMKIGYSEEEYRLMECLAGITDQLDTSFLTSNLSTILGLLGDLFEWTSLSDSEKNPYIEFMWDLVNSATDSDGNTIQAIMSATDYAAFKQSFAMLIDSVLTFLVRDYDGEYGSSPSGYLSASKAQGQTGVILGTLLYNIINDRSSIVYPHYGRSYYTWLVMEDSFYSEECIITLNGRVIYLGDTPDADNNLLNGHLIFASYTENGQFLDYSETLLNADFLRRMTADGEIALTRTDSGEPGTETQICLVNSVFEPY